MIVRIDTDVKTLAFKGCRIDAVKRFAGWDGWLVGWGTGVERVEAT